MISYRQYIVLIKDKCIVDYLFKHYRQLLSIPKKIYITYKYADYTGICYPDLTICINHEYMNTPIQTTTILIHELIHAYQFKRNIVSDDYECLAIKAETLIRQKLHKHIKYNGEQLLLF